MAINVNKLVNVVASKKLGLSLKSSSCVLGNTESAHTLSETEINPIRLKSGASFQSAAANITINLPGWFTDTV